MSKLVYALIIILMVFTGLTFTYMNNQIIEIRYFSVSGEVSVSILLLSTLIVGVLIGFAGNAIVLFKSHLSNSRLKKEIKGLKLL